MPPSLNRLAHLHLPNPISYAHSLRLQEAVLNRHWAYRDAMKSNPPASSSLHPPPPTLLTFSTHPTYTVGRRHLTLNPLSDEQITFLTGTSTSSNPSAQSNVPSATSSEDQTSQPASFHPSPRGGLLTYHAPGQLTAYPLIDLRRFGLSARQYISLLEDVVINTCKNVGVDNVGRSCGDPGVWMLNAPNPANDGKEQVSDRKICAIGVRITRGTTSHGIGLNVHDFPIPTRLRSLYKFQDPDGNALEFDGEGEDGRGYLSWGFGRIVACGLEGKRSTWLTKEGAEQGLGVEEVARVFAGELLRGLNVASGEKGGERLEEIEECDEQDISGHEEKKER